MQAIATIPAMPEPTTINLWPSDAASDATLTWRPAADASATRGACVMICPGGAYGRHAPHESEPVADWLNAHGFHAAVLRYRLAPKHRHPAMIQDAQRGIRLLRHHAGEWGLNPRAVAALGFSAGGHLASSLAVHHERFHCAQDELAGVEPARPDAVVLCYPVIDMAGPMRHGGSCGNLLGREVPGELLDLMSTQRHVTAESPPAFIWHTADDPAVPLQNAIDYAMACRNARVPVELHVYETGKHGLGLADERPDIATWKDHCIAFLRRRLVARQEERAASPHR
jgi:acetyl esterase/lipase